MHKKIIQTKRTIWILLIVLLISSMAISQTVLAWDDCPFGYIDDPYPGACPRYIDTNNDGICDHSQSDPAMATEPIDSTSDVSNESEIKTTGSPWFENENLVRLIVSFFIILIGVLLTKYANKHGIIPSWKTRSIWNILLLIFFIPTSITGILLVTHNSFPLPPTLLLLTLQLHTITSFFFMWISGVHILQHPKYYTRSTKKLITSTKKS